MSLATWCVIWRKQAAHLEVCVGSSPGEKRRKRESLTCLHDRSLAVVGSRTGVEALVCSNEPSVKRPLSQDQG